MTIHYSKDLSDRCNHYFKIIESNIHPNKFVYPIDLALVKYFINNMLHIEYFICVLPPLILIKYFKKKYYVNFNKLGGKLDQGIYFM